MQQGLSVPSHGLGRLREIFNVYKYTHMEKTIYEEIKELLLKEGINVDDPGYVDRLMDKHDDLTTIYRHRLPNGSIVRIMFMPPWSGNFKEETIHTYPHFTVYRGSKLITDTRCLVEAIEAAAKTVIDGEKK